MIKIEATEPIDGLQLRAMASQLKLFIDNIDQVSLEDSKWNALRTEAIKMKTAAEEMICLTKIENGLEGSPVAEVITIYNDEAMLVTDEAE